MSEPQPIYVHLLPAMIPPGSLGGGVAIVLDVLRATTVMIRALHEGATSIMPCLEIDEAKRLASRLPDGQAVLAGERHGLPIAGFDFGNSPISFTREVCGGKIIVMTTTNGTRAIHAALDADRILVASFLNLLATVEALGAEQRPVHVICAGTNGMVSFEDSLLAGAIVSSVRASHALDGNDESLLVEAAWGRAKGELLDEVLGRGVGGRRVREIGLSPDIAVAADVDRFGFVAEVVRNPIRVIRVESSKSR